MTLHRTAPPSAPVGVEDIIEAFDEITGLCRHLRQGGPAPEDLHGLYGALDEAIGIAGGMLAALAQQPASDGGFTAADMMDARQEGRKEAQQPAAEPYKALFVAAMNTAGQAMDYVQNNPDKFDARPGDDKLAIVCREFLKAQQPAAEDGVKCPWDGGSPCVEPMPAGMVYPKKPAPRAGGYLDTSGVEWNAWDAGQMEAYARAAYSDGWEAGYRAAIDQARGKGVQDA